MSRTKGSFSLAGAIEPLISAPLDARDKVATKAELTVSGNFPYPYVGMETYVVSEDKKYRLIGEDPTDIDNWKEIAEGDSEEIQVTVMPTAGSEYEDKIVQYVGDTDSTYTNGYFYKCVEDSGSYSWVATSVQDVQGGGHTIVDVNDTELTQRDKLKFGEGMSVTDDSTDEQTVVAPNKLESGDMEEIVYPLPTVPHPKTSCGYTPVGTVISVMGITAPLHYLPCNGQIVNIADYPELANYFEGQFGSKNYFGGDGTTTFAVPNLQGQFLRGTGTNSDTSQGSGAAVGTRQKATEIPVMSVNYVDATQNNLYYAGDSSTGSGSASNAIANPDSTRNITTVATVSFNKDSKIARTGSQPYRHTVRPTNTSVLWCIATKDIYIDARYDYSTNEKVVGSWLDGSTLYQRTIVDTMPVIATDGTVAVKGIDISSWHLNECVSVEGMAYISNNFNAIDSCWNLSGAGSPQYFIRTNVGLINDAMSFQIRCNRSALSEANFYATLRYTKTT